MLSTKLLWVWIILICPMTIQQCFLQKRNTHVGCTETSSLEIDIGPSVRKSFRIASSIKLRAKNFWKQIKAKTEVWFYFSHVVLNLNFKPNASAKVFYKREWGLGLRRRDGLGIWGVLLSGQVWVPATCRPTQWPCDRMWGFVRGLSGWRAILTLKWIQNHQFDENEMLI